ncbi:MAG: polymer-forming cytoskeletal protein [bacterium]
MKGKKNETETRPANSGPADMKAVLGKGSEFEGTLRFEGTVRIDGKFQGEVHSEGTLIVGENAVINGDLFVDSAVISGEIRGNVKAKNRVELRAPGKLFGDLESPALTIEEGVIFDGNCRMSKENKKAGAEGVKPAEPEKKTGENTAKPPEKASA